MTVTIEMESDIDLGFDYKKTIHDIIDAALTFESCPYEAEINIILTTNEEIALINRDYRDIHAPTDVLSFPMADFIAPGDFTYLANNNPNDYFNPESGELMLGDIIISVDKVVTQAEKFGHSKERELGFLVAHSILHLFGYDHQQPEETELMEIKQNDILDYVGLKR